MRYLKTYKLFESNKFDDQRPSDQTKLVDDVEDILLDLSDNGFEVDIHIGDYAPPMLDDSLKSLVVDINPLEKDTFTWDDIKDVITRLEEYCFRKDAGYSIDVQADDESRLYDPYRRKSDYMHLPMFIDIYGDKKLSRLHLYIYSEDDYGDLLNQKDMNESFNSKTALNQDYDIYSFDQNLGSWTRHYSIFGKQKNNNEQLDIWTDHFIGDGFYKKLDEHMTKVYDVMKKVDLDNINDRFLELWDDLEVDTNWILPAITYGDYYRVNEDNKGSSRDKYNGTMPVRDLDDSTRRNNIMSEIIRAILRPTLNVGYSSNNVYIRNTQEELYVTDEKYQCENFDFSNYSYFKGFSGDKLLWKKDAKDNKYDIGKDEDSIVELSSYEWKKYEMYSPENVMNMYVPCIYINMGENGKRIGMILSELESRLDDIVDAILPELDYKEVVWDMSRGTRKFSSHRDAHEYRLKILLNF